MAIERLTAEDQLMLWPDAIWPQDIGAICILDGARLLDPDGRFRIEAVREAVTGRLQHVPRFRQLLKLPPPELGGPLWVDAPRFDVADHVRAMSVSGLGDEAALLGVVEQLRRRHLDPSRPLWEMWFLTGLTASRIGLFVRTHHCIADGIAGMATMAAFLDAGVEAAATPEAPWSPEPPPSDDDLRADHRRRLLEQRSRRLTSLRHPLKTAHGALDAWPAVRELLAEPSLPATSLDHVVGPDRCLALVRGSLGEVKAVAHAHGAKVNDVLLTAIAGGLRALLSARGETVDVLRVYVPVSMRHGQYAGARGNQIAQMVVPLPITESDPLARLMKVAAETAIRKARTRPSLGKVPHRGLVGRAFLRLINRQHVNVTTADIPGPPIPMYLAGARLLEVFPLLPLIGRVSLGVGAMSYDGQFNVTAVADRDAYPDLEVFATGFRDELATLATAIRSKQEVA